MSDPIPPAPSTYDLRPIEVFLVPERPRRRYWLHALLLLATIFTTLVVGARLEFNFLQQPAGVPAGPMMQPSALPLFPLDWVLEQPSRLLLGVPFAAHADADPAGARDGTLPLLRALRRERNPAVLHPGADADRDPGRVHPHQVADPLARSAVRHRHRGADCRIRGRAGHSDRRPQPVQAAAAGRAGVRHRLRISAGLPLRALVAGDHGHQRAGTVSPRRGVSAPHGHRCLGGNVCHRAEPACPAVNSTAATWCMRFRRGCTSTCRG